MATATYQPIISAAEVWTAAEGSQSLRPDTSLSEMPENVAGRIVERAAAELGPVILSSDELDGADGMALMGIPVIVEKKLKACLVLSIFCPEESMGAFEIWSRDNRDELGLNGAVFAGLSRFASISEHVKFPRGSGLPGQSWEQRQALLITGLGSSPNFMRAAGARAGGLDVGVGLPVMTTEHDLNSVILLLSSRDTPIAKVFEIWDVEGRSISLRAGAEVDCEATLEEARSLSYTIGEGLVGKVVETGVPFVTDDLPAVERKRLASLHADEISSVIAMPIYVGESIKSVFVMFN